MMFHVKQRQHELSSTRFRAAKNNDVLTPTLPLGQNKRSFVVKRPWRNDQKQAGFPGCRDLDNPDQASTTLLRTLRSPTPVPSPLHAHGRLRPTFDLQARSASRFVCRQNARAARPPAHGTRSRNAGPMGWLAQEISRASSTRRMPVAGLKDFSDLRNVLDSLSGGPGKSDIRASGMPTTKHVIKAGGHGPWHRMAIFVSRETSRLNTANTEEQKYKTGVSFRSVEPHRSRRENATIQRLNTFG